MHGNYNRTYIYRYWLFCSKIVANYISKPLKELENYTVKIAHKDWSEPIKIKSEDEIGRLAKA
ncbi:HAMP domain-containing protein [Thermoanaerobacter thermocopriae]|nr:HAMP domain-containing protein [Thermoanaerobacter thermocopriae]